MVMWTDLTWVSPSLVRLAARASEDGPVPSSEAMMRMGRVVSLGASEGMSQAAALARSSRARDSGVQLARGDMPLSARPLAICGTAASCLLAWTAGRVRPAMLAAEMRTTALM